MKVDLNNKFLWHYQNYFVKILANIDKPDFETLCEALTEDLEGVMEEIYTSIYLLLIYYADEYVKDKKELSDKVESVKENILKFACGKNYPATVLKAITFDNEAFESINSMFMTRAETINKKYLHSKLYLKFLRNRLVKLIQMIGKKMDDFEMLTDYQRISNSMCGRYKVPELKIRIGSSQDVEYLTTSAEDKEAIQKEINRFFLGKDKEEIFPETVRMLFDTRYLDSLSFYKLIIMATFWVNRFSKAVHHLISIMLLLSDNRNLIVGIKKNQISLKDLKFWFKDNVSELNRKFDFYLKMWKSKHEGRDNPYDKVPSYEHEKLDNIFPLYVAMCDSYLLKQLNIFVLLELIESSEIKEIKNFGLVKSEMGKNMVLFAFDVPGFNLPFSVHLEKEAIIYYYKEMKKKEKVRYYVGIEDFFNEKGRWTTSLLYPLSTKQKNVLNKINPNRRDIQHIKFLQDGKWPKHMRNKANKPIRDYWRVEA